MLSKHQLKMEKAFRSFDPAKSKGFMVKLSEELYDALKSYSSEKGLSMSHVVRNCIADLFTKGDLKNMKRFSRHL